MKRVVIGILIALLLVGNGFLLGMIYGPLDYGRQDVVDSAQAQQVTLPPETVWVPPTEPTEPPPTTLPDEYFTLSFAGDCALGATPGSYYAQLGFVKTVGDDLSYPFKNVASFFENDDFSMVNLECVLGPENLVGRKQSRFLGLPEYAKSLSMSGIEAVSLANDHTMDYGEEGYASTVEALDGEGVAYVENNATKLVTTDSGLVIGLYASCQESMDQRDMAADIAALKEQGAQLIVVATHWGTDRGYEYGYDQEIFGRAAIDYGAHIVVGTNPRVLRKVEEYNGGVIFFSLGMFSYGGHGDPSDYDTAIIQQQVIRHGDGRVSLGERTYIPASVSSVAKPNNFQPTPYAEGTAEYDRVLAKLSGTFG